MSKVHGIRFDFSAVLSVFAIACLLAATAVADTLELTNGRSLEGRSVVRDNGDVELHSSMGMIVIPAAKVAKLRKAQTIEDRVLDELVARSNVTADDLFELGEEARRGGASTLAKDLFSEAIRLDPDHEASRHALGYYRTDEGWRTGPPPARRSTRRVNIEQAERVALLRALRAQANAARVAEQQRQILLATQTALANAANAQSAAVFDGHIVQRVLPIVPGISHGFVPVPPRTATRTRSGGRSTPGHAVGAPQKPKRRSRTNTIVRIPRP